MQTLIALGVILFLLITGTLILGMLSALLWPLLVVMVLYFLWLALINNPWLVLLGLVIAAFVWLVKKVFGR